MKPGSRFLGVDDGPREAEKLIGVSYRGTEFMEQVEILSQEPDTGESTGKILELYSLFKQDIKAVLLDGVSFNGFNVADIETIADETGKPVISVTGNEPSKDAMRDGMKSADLDAGIIDQLPEVHSYREVYIQFSGCSLRKAEKIIDAATLQGNIPEAVRAAHLIGSGLENQH